MNKEIWILTREINEYDQDGSYFVAWFEDIDNIQVVLDVISKYDKYYIKKPFSDEFIENLKNGGGRLGGEYEWFYLRKMDPATLYIPEYEMENNNEN